MKTALFKSNGIEDLEGIVNAWLEKNFVTIEDLLFSPCSPGKNEEEKFALLIISEAPTACTTRIKIIDSGVHGPEQMALELDEWLAANEVNGLGSKQVIAPAIGLHTKVRVYYLVLYEPV